jgi:protein phosphatase
MSETVFEIAGKTDPGKVRERNEDSIGLLPELGLLVVADGMGGHNSGEVASGLATETILNFAKSMLGQGKTMVPEGEDHGLSVPARQLVHFIKNANTIIFEKSRAFAKDHGMGTTVVAVLTGEKSITVAHVGDSRLYLLRNGNLERLTEDHSLVMDQVKHGLITEEQAEKSHLQNILTRALGTEENVEVDVQDHPVLPGDVLMLCSDGLTKMVTDQEMAEVLSSPGNPQAWTDRFIEMANAAGGVDNVTVAIARVAPERPGGLKGFVRHLFGG